MPLYTYRCEQCAAVFDQRAPVAQAGEPVPHECGGSAPRYYARTPTITFRPEGYYLSPEQPEYWSTLKDKETRPTWQR